VRGGWWRESGAARLSVLCAVLLGLVLMHGNPAAAASGCHGAMVVSAGAPGNAAADMAMPAMDASHGADPASTDSVVGVSDTDHGASLHGHAAMEGASCLATPARGGLHLPAPGLLAGGALTTVLLISLGATIAGGRRGPPDGGRNLLLRVCVART
jgi:hypothetical protein